MLRLKVCEKKRPLAFLAVLHEEKPIPETGGGAPLVQGAPGEHKEKPGFGGKGGEHKEKPGRIRISPVRIRAETVSIRKSREHKGRSPRHKKNNHAPTFRLQPQLPQPARELQLFLRPCRFAAGR